MSKDSSQTGEALGGLIVLGIIGYLVYSLYSFIFNSTEREIKRYVECSIASRELGRMNAQLNIQNKFEDYLNENKEKVVELGSLARVTMKISEEYRNDFGIIGMDTYDMNEKAITFALVKKFNSCKELHGQEKIKMPLLYYATYIFI